MASATTVVAAFATSAIAAITAVATTASGRTKILFGDITHCLYSAFDAHLAVDKLMVEVHLDIVRSHVYYETLDAESVSCHHRQTHTFLDIFFIKFSVDFKDFATEFDNFFGIVAAESLLGDSYDVVALPEEEFTSSALPLSKPPCDPAEEEPPSFAFGFAPVSGPAPAAPCAACCLYSSSAIL